MPPTLLKPGSLTRPKGEAAVPADFIMQLLKDRLPEYRGKPPAAIGDRILVIESETGSGKSTLLPVYALRLLRPQTEGTNEYRGRSVLCTQPRVLTAMTLARDVAGKPFYPDIVLGRSVGFQTGVMNFKPRAGLIYATIGVLLAQLISADELAEQGDSTGDSQIADAYAVIIVDEAHERAVEADMTAMYIKRFMARMVKRRAKNLPVIIFTSATLPAKQFVEHFEVPAAGWVAVAGASYHKEDHWPPHGSNDYVAAAVERALAINAEGADDKPEEADVMIFLPGAAEQRRCLDLFGDAHKRGEVKGRAILPLVIDSVAVNSQTRAFRLTFAPPGDLLKEKGALVADDCDSKLPPRRIIITTSVAETGLTVDTLKHVIDCGWARAPETYWPSGARGLLTKPAPRSRITQRRGRCGRLFPGHFWPLYTEKTHGLLPAQQQADLATSGLGPAFLHLIAATGSGSETLDLGQLDMLEVPPHDVLRAALYRATLLGFTTPAGALTPMGQWARRARGLSLPQLRLVASGRAYGLAARDVATVAALLGDEAPSLRDLQAPRDKAAPKKMADAVGAVLPTNDYLGDDFLIIAVLFAMFMRELVGNANADELDEWARARGTHLEGLVKLASVREMVLGDMVRLGVVTSAELGAGDGTLLGAARDAATFLPLVRSLKQSLYESLRFNTLHWQGPQAQGFYTTSPAAGGLRVWAPRIVPTPEDPAHKPQLLVAARLTVGLPPGMPPRALAHQLNAELVSVISWSGRKRGNFHEGPGVFPEVAVVPEPELLEPAVGAPTPVQSAEKSLPPQEALRGYQQFLRQVYM